MSWNPFRFIHWDGLLKPFTFGLTGVTAYFMIFDNNYGNKPHVFSSVQKSWYEKPIESNKVLNSDHNGECSKV